ncbi:MULTISPECIES: hypothetical protein [unclassified Actinoplanes]|uniref:hypothetical protein n=1 Tax=unclassified Actinoplanes TaxID=2626549 RepID=UPI000303400C|nr:MULTISPECIES: hypothetical protein [unclassified Actinoplanes]SLM01505.1 hypothetical protein ACSP50_4741 [Actinoplanes sp. SE50/110]
MSASPARLTAARSAGLLLAGAVLGAGLTPVPALADGPGYGGTANALTVAWNAGSEQRGVAVYAVGFRSGSPVQVRVGGEAERSVTADPSGAIDMVLTAATTTATAATVASAAVTTATAAAAGTIVLVSGHTPAGELRTLVGAVPPEAAGIGVAQLVPWAATLVGLGGAALWLRRRYATVAAGQLSRYRHPARHRA